MNQDLISRHAVNDMLKELTKKASGRATLFNSAYAYYRGAISDVYYGVKGLPSAQPEIIYCKDCKNSEHWYRDRRRCFLWSEDGVSVFDDGFCNYAERRQDADSSGNISGTQKELKCTETHSCDCERTETHEWIPVSEALPEDGVTVWVTIRGYDVIRCEEGETLEQAIARIGKIRWVTQGYWSEEEHGWNDPSFGCPLMVQPIAWMPIDTPEPWKGR